MNDVKGPNITQTIEAPGSNDLFEVLSSIEVNEPSNPIEEPNVEESKESEPKEEESSEEKGKEPEVLTEEAKDSESATKPQEKTVSAFRGDSKIDIPEDAVFKIKVDGKEVDVTLTELQRNYQGKIPLDKHFAENKAKAKELETREAHLAAKESASDNKLKEILEIFDKNPYLAFEKIAIMKGRNPTDYLPIYIAQSKKTLEELQKLSEAEYRALLIHKNNEYKEIQLKEQNEKLESEKTEQQRARESLEAENYFTSKAREMGVTQAEVDMASMVIQGAGIDLSNKSPKDIAELVLNYIEHTERPIARIESVVKEVDESLLKNQPLMSEMKKLITKDFTSNDIREILLGYIKDSKPKAQPQTAPQQGNPSNGAKPKSPQGMNKGQALRAEEAPRQRVNGADDVGPMSYFDILADYE